jgi:hypothetical protein
LKSVVQEMAKRSIPLAGRIFRFAIRKGIIENDPTPHYKKLKAS